MCIKGPSNVLGCDIKCRTFQGGGEHHVILRLSNCSDIWELTMVIYGCKYVKAETQIEGAQEQVTKENI
jgi:hypothetical protein